MRLNLVLSIIITGMLLSAYATTQSSAWVMPDGLIACDPIVEDYHIAAISVSGYQDATLMPRQMFDISTTTYWADSSAPATLQLKLKTPKVLCSTDIAFYKGNERINEFKVQISSDGTNWIDAYNGKSSGVTTGLQHFIFNNKYLAMQYLRYTFTPVQGLTGITKLMIDAPNPDRYAFDLPSGYTPTSFDSITTVISDSSFDKFGIKKIYPTKDGKEWYVNLDDPRNDSRFTNWGNIDHFEKHGQNTWHLYDDQVRVQAASPVNNKWLNIEMTGYYQVIDSGNGYLVQQYGRGGRHSTSDPCLGSAYKARLLTDGTAMWVKEVMHPAYTSNRGNVDVSSENLEGKWIGFKAVMYNMKDSSGQTYVRLESYVDLNVSYDPATGKLTPSNNWKKASVVDDKGGWTTNDSDFKANCPPLEVGSTSQYRQRDEILSMPGTIGLDTNVVAWRTDQTSWQFRYLTVREIVPPVPTVTPISDKSLMATMIQYVNLQTQTRIYADNMIQTDQAKLHVGLDKGFTDAQVSAVMSMDGMRGIEFFSLDEIRQHAPTLKSKGFDYVAYDLEPGDGYSPQVEVDNAVASVREASEIVHANGLLLQVAPARAITTNYGVQMAPYVDLYHIQSQALQGNPDSYESYLETMIPKLRQANPDIKAITVQLSTSRESATGMTLLETMKDNWTRVADVADGVTVWFQNNETSLGILDEFVDWFDTTGRTLTPA